MLITCRRADIHMRIILAGKVNMSLCRPILDDNLIIVNVYSVCRCGYWFITSRIISVRQSCGVIIFRLCCIFQINCKAIRRPHFHRWVISGKFHFRIQRNRNCYLSSTTEFIESCRSIFRLIVSCLRRSPLIVSSKSGIGSQNRKCLSVIHQNFIAGENLLPIAVRRHFLVCRLIRPICKRCTVIIGSPYITAFSI